MLPSIVPPKRPGRVAIFLRPNTKGLSLNLVLEITHWEIQETSLNGSEARPDKEES